MQHKKRWQRKRILPNHGSILASSVHAIHEFNSCEGKLCITHHVWWEKVDWFVCHVEVITIVFVSLSEANEVATEAMRNTPKAKHLKVMSHFATKLTITSPSWCILAGKKGFSVAADGLALELDGRIEKKMENLPPNKCSHPRCCGVGRCSDVSQSVCVSSWLALERSNGQSHAFCDDCHQPTMSALAFYSQIDICHPWRHPLLHCLLWSSHTLNQKTANM